MITILPIGKISGPHIQSHKRIDS